MRKNEAKIFPVTNVGFQRYKIRKNELIVFFGEYVGVEALRERWPVAERKQNAGIDKIDT